MMKTYICKPISWFSTHQYAAWWLVDYSRHLQSRRSHASLPFWNNSFPKYWVGVSAELKISFLWKYEKCFLCTFRIRIRILISLRVLWESHPLTACACLHTTHLLHLWCELHTNLPTKTFQRSDVMLSEAAAYCAYTDLHTWFTFYCGFLIK